MVPGVGEDGNVVRGSGVRNTSSELREVEDPLSVKTGTEKVD